MTDWYIARPWWLLLAALVLPLLFIGSRQASGLPAAWSRLVAPTLQAYLGRWLPTDKRTASRMAYAALLLLLAAGLADISLGTTERLPARALHARVLIIDTAMLPEAPQILFSARRLATAAPDIPTAIIAASESAYDVVPLTTDPVQLDRYLQVLGPSLMPDPGRRLHPTIERAANMLNQAGILAGQIIILSAGSAPPTARESPRGRASLSLLLARNTDQPWRDYAHSIGAQIAGVGDVDSLNSTLLERRDRNARQLSAIQEGRRLTPWIIGACMPLWALLFFRRRNA